ncbi:hypothetical protein LWM68_08695 [Niabella sp. W65]|nr:hypothetical protein [Niabella sp. W65]MCH7362841.1 hypothetical protein [Niabella sp. W65]ULT38794.1 hypothetical protein KRR40_27370 [Niabella sp. I65]
MDIQKEKFQAKQSERAEKTTFLVRAVGRTFYITVLRIIEFTIIVLPSNEIGVFFIRSISISSSIFLIRTFIQQRIEDKIIKSHTLLLTKNGFHHFLDLKAAESMTFDLLRPNPDKNMMLTYRMMMMVMQIYLFTISISIQIKLYARLLPLKHPFLLKMVEN